MHFRKMHFSKMAFEEEAQRKLALIKEAMEALETGDVLRFVMVLGARFILSLNTQPAEILQLFGGLVLGCIKTNFCNEICV